MFADIYQALIDKIKVILPDSKELLFPYNLEELNKDDNLSIGFGLLVGSSEVESHYFYRRNIGIVLTRRFKQGARSVKECELVDEAHNLAYSLKQSLVGCNKITDMIILGDEGIQFFEDNKYLQITLNVELLYQEF